MAEEDVREIPSGEGLDVPLVAGPSEKGRGQPEGTKVSIPG